MMTCMGCTKINRRGFLRSAVLLGGGMIGYLLRGHLPAWAFSVISEEQEEAMGRKAHQQVLAQFGYYNDASLQAFVTQVGQRVLREAESSPFKFQFTVVDDPMVNAFAVPGGYVYVTRGILAELNSEAELATILGHEIAHVTSHHSAQQMTRAMGAQLLALGLAVVSPGGEQNRAGWTAISNEIATQILLGYGRDAENEADEKGLKWAVKAGYDPRGMLGFLRNLQIKYRLSGIGYHPLRATHPEILERIDRDRVMIEVLTEEAKEPLEVKADEYKARLDGMVYGKRGEKKEVRVIAAPGGGSVKDITKALWGTENRAWELAMLNGIRDQDRPLHPGEKIKMIYDPSEEPPPRFQDLSLSIH